MKQFIFIGQTLVALACAALSSVGFANCGNQLVLNPVPGLYEKLPRSVELPIGHFRLSTSTLGTLGGSNLIGLLSILTQEGKAVAVAERHFSPNRRRMVLANLSTIDRVTLNRLAPSFLNSAGMIALVEGRGIPTSVLMTLNQMRLADVGYGELREVYALEVTNAATLLALRNRPAIATWMELHPNQFPPHELLASEMLATNTGRYIQTILTQAGSRITNVRTELGRLVYAGELLHLRNNDPQVMQARGSLAPLARVPSSFNIILRVEPL